MLDSFAFQLAQLILGWRCYIINLVHAQCMHLRTCSSTTELVIPRESEDY